MGCGCRKNKKEARYAVVASSGREIYTTDSKTTAEVVARRYANARVEQKG